MTIIEKLLLGLQAIGLGMGFVFLTLVLLIFVIKLIALLTTPKETPICEACVLKLAMEESLEMGTNPEIIAAITAAINVMYSNKPEVRFVVRKIKRI